MIQHGYGQNGKGIEKMLRNLMRWITPLARKHVLPSIQEGFKTVGNHVIDSVANFA